MRDFNGKEYIEKEQHDINELLKIVSILRGPNGCPWDMEQTHESMKKCLLDETQEVIEAIDNKDDNNLCEELGDVLLQVLLHCEIANERAAFNFGDVVQMLSEKLIRRHPHVFGDVERPKTAEDGLKLWKTIKQKEKNL